MNKIYDIAVTDDATEPITLSAMKEFLRVTSTDDDTIITDLITISRQKLERYTGRSLVVKSIILTAYLDCPILLPYPKFDGVTTVKILQGQTSVGANDWDTLDAIDYQLLGTVDVTFIPQQAGVYEITYATDTYSVNASGVLYDLKRICLWLYENRGDDSDNMPVELMSNAKHLRILSWE